MKISGSQTLSSKRPTQRACSDVDSESPSQQAGMRLRDGYFSRVSSDTAAAAVQELHLRLSPVGEKARARTHTTHMRGHHTHTNTCRMHQPFLCRKSCPVWGSKNMNKTKIRWRAGDAPRSFDQLKKVVLCCDRPRDVDGGWGTRT